MNCSSCGGGLTTNEKTCKYCGAVNPGYVAPSAQSGGYTSTAPRYTPPRTESYNSSAPVPKKSVNWFAFFVLLIVFWPAAIAYLIIRSK